MRVWDARTGRELLSLEGHAHEVYSVVMNARGDRVISGSDDERAIDVLRHLYAPFVRTNDRILTMDAISAELTTYASNAYRYAARARRAPAASSPLLR